MRAELRVVIISIIYYFHSRKSEHIFEYQYKRSQLKYSVGVDISKKGGSYISFGLIVVSNLKCGCLFPVDAQ